MIQIRSLFMNLTRPEVGEIAMVSGRPPCISVGGVYQPVDPVGLSTDEILQILFSAGGSRYVDSLGPKATQWSTRIEGVGTVSVSALMQGAGVQARFTLKRDSLADVQVRSSPEPKIGELKISEPKINEPKISEPKISEPKIGEPKPQGARPPAYSFGKQSFPALKVDLDDSVPPSTRVRILPVPPAIAAPPPGHAQARQAGVVSPGNPVIHDDTPPSEHRGRVQEPISFPPPSSADFSTDVAYRVTPADAIPAYVPPPASIPAVPPPARTPTMRTSIAQPAVEPQAPQPSARRTEIPPPPGRITSRPVHDPAAARAFDELLAFARTTGTSDLHIIAGRPPLLRISGELLPHGEPMDPGLVERMLLPKVPARLMPALDRDGSCDFSLHEPSIGRLRVNVGRHRGGLKASMRLIPDEIPTLAALGLPEAIGSATHHHQGLIVLTGPTGHGKTTTLAALVDILNSSRPCHIITVEDPVEFIHPRKQAMVSQREVGTHTKTFHSALKGSLREDPDVLVVGELRDTETMRLALSASETGHLVIGTMNTPSAAKTIDRIIDLFPPGDQQQVRMTLAGGLRLIVSQRLLPAADGSGLVAAAEILPGIPPLWNLIRDSKTWQIPSLQQRGRGLGIIRLDDSLADLVRAGKVTTEHALLAAESPEELEAVLSGKRQPVAPPLETPKPGQTGPTGAAAEQAMKDLLGKAGSLFKRK